MGTRAFLLLACILGAYAAACSSGEEAPEAIESAVPASDLTEDVVVGLCPTWEEGEQRKFDLIKSGTRPGPSGKEVSGQTRTTMDAVVTKADESGYLFRWTFGAWELEELQLDGEAVPDADIKKALDQLGSQQFAEFVETFEDLPLEVETDECGAFLALANLEEIQSLADESVEFTLQLLENAGEVDPDGRAAVRESMARMFASEGAIEQVFGKYAIIHYQIFGEPISSNEPLVFDDLLPNVFGGEPFPAQTRYSLREYDRASSCGVVTSRTILDPDQFERILKETFSDLAAQIGSEPPLEGELPEFEIKIEGEFAFCEDSGWLQSAKVERSIKVEGQSRIDTLELIDTTEP